MSFEYTIRCYHEKLLTSFGKVQKTRYVCVCVCVGGCRKVSQVGLDAMSIKELRISNKK